MDHSHPILITLNESYYTRSEFDVIILYRSIGVNIKTNLDSKIEIYEKDKSKITFPEDVTSFF